MNAPISPSIFICPGDSFMCAPDDPITIRATAGELRNDYYRRLTIFDSAGQVWRVSAVQPTRKFTLWDRLLARRLDARLICHLDGTVNMKGIVENLCILVDNDPDDLYDQFVSHNDLKRMFREAESPRALVDVARRLGGEAVQIPRSA